MMCQEFTRCKRGCSFDPCMPYSVYKLYCIYTLYLFPPFYGYLGRQLHTMFRLEVTTKSHFMAAVALICF
jgi:hypothetical protein